MNLFGFYFSGMIALVVGAASIIGFGMGVWLGFQIARKGFKQALEVKSV